MLNSPFPAARARSGVWCRFLKVQMFVSCLWHANSRVFRYSLPAPALAENDAFPFFPSSPQNNENGIREEKKKNEFRIMRSLEAQWGAMLKIEERREMALSLPDFRSGTACLTNKLS